MTTIAPLRADRDSARVPPHDDDAERAVLGAMLLAPTSAIHDALSEELHPEHFYSPRLGATCAAILQVHADGYPVDVLTVAAKTQTMGLPMTVPDLSALQVDVPSTRNAGTYARRVVELAASREQLTSLIELEGRVWAGADPEAIRSDLAALAAAAPASPGRGRRFRSGAAFVLDDPVDLDPVWGAGDQVLWARGEPLLLAGPTGVGKTTVALQLVAGRLGVLDQVLGQPIAAADKPVLYLAMDRSHQIRRAMRRGFDEQHRTILDERLVVWEGPLPGDLGKKPELLAQMCHEAGAGTVVIDSLKDAAVKLTDDEAGGNLNRAVQQAIVEGVEVLGLHHQRKGQGGAKPTTLEDLYGSTWIAAGAGSVILLWGAAGDPLVELRHLKQPAAEVGPLKLEHDHHAGTTSIYRDQVDPLAVLRHAVDGITATDLARMMGETDRPGDNQRKKAQRALDRLVRDGHAQKRDAVLGGDGGATAARYYVVTDRQEQP